MLVRPMTKIEIQKTQESASMKIQPFWIGFLGVFGGGLLAMGILFKLSLTIVTVAIAYIFGQAR